MKTNRTSLFSRPSLATADAWSRLLASLAGASIVGLAAAPALAAPPGNLRVNVQAPAGKGCISADKLKSAVQKHTKGPAKSAAVDVQIEAADSGPGWVADVAVAGRAGHRIVKTPSPACSKLDEGLVLVVTLLVDPDDDEDPPPAAPPPGKADSDSPGDADKVPEAGSSWGKDDPAEDEPGDEEPAAGKKPGAPQGDSPNAPEPEGGPWGKQGKKGDKGSPDKDPANKDSADKDSADKDPGKKGGKDKGGKEEGEAKKKLQFGIGASVVYAAGLVPQDTQGVRATFSWLSPTPVGLEGSFTYYLPVDEWRGDANANAIRHVETFSIELDVCPARLDVGRLHFGACAGVDVTRYQYWLAMSGPTLDNTYTGYGTQEAWMASPVADLRFDVSLFSALRIGVGLKAQVPINRPGADNWFPQDGTPDPFNYKALAEPVIFQARAGITVVLPP